MKCNAVYCLCPQTETVNVLLRDLVLVNIDTVVRNYVKEGMWDASTMYKGIVQ